MSDINVSPSINDYFEVVVQEAIRTRKVEATDAATHYIIGLLCDYARPDRDASSTFTKPLTFLLRDALAAVGADRFERLRKFGDGVMYLLGFFDSNLTRRGADREYVISLGSSAYSHAAAMLRASGSGHEVDVLGELSDKYERFVEVVGEVADTSLASSSVHRDSSALQLYERWKRTGSQRLAEQLAELGLCPVAAAGGVN